MLNRIVNSAKKTRQISPQRYRNLLFDIGLLSPVSSFTVEPPDDTIVRIDETDVMNGIWDRIFNTSCQSDVAETILPSISDRDQKDLMTGEYLSPLLDATSPRDCKHEWEWELILLRCI
jgi:hypothetical protein